MTIDISLTIPVISTATTILCWTAIYLWKQTFNRPRRKQEPPIVGGHFLWGSAKDFNENAIKFLQSSEKEHGRVFTMRLINQYITIIMDPNCYESVLREKNFDFDKIQKQVNNNVFNFHVKNASAVIKDVSRAARGTYMNADVNRFCHKLKDSFDLYNSNHRTGIMGSVMDDDDDVNTTTTDVIGLRKFCSETVFDAIFNSLFGQCDRQSSFNPQTMYNNMDVYHRWFNYMWLGFPKTFMPGIMSTLKEMCQQPNAEELLARSDCCEYIKRGIRHLLSNGQNQGDICGMNLVLLHVNYNTFRLAYWILYYIIKNSEAWEKLEEEVDNLINNEKGDVNVSQSDIDSLRVLDSIVQEGARLCSGVFMVRYVEKDTLFKTTDGVEYLIREGDRVAMYPPAIHKDGEIFEDPLTFKYDRFINNVFYKNNTLIRNPVMPFGTICPGKRLATLQLKMFIVNTVANYKLNMADKNQTAELDYTYHGHEVLPPIKDVDIGVIRKHDKMINIIC